LIPARNQTRFIRVREQRSACRRYLSESSMALVLAAGPHDQPGSPDPKELPQLTAP